MPADRIYVCPPGAPAWQPLGRAPQRTARRHTSCSSARWSRARTSARCSTPTTRCSSGAPPRRASSWPAAPPRTPPAGSRAWRAAAGRPRRRISATCRRTSASSCTRRARLLVLPSLDEGFGLTGARSDVGRHSGDRLESRFAARGRRQRRHASSSPATSTASPQRSSVLRSTTPRPLAHARAGLARARAFTWDRAAATLRQAYADALARRRQRESHAGRRRAR